MPRITFKENKFVWALILLAGFTAWTYLLLSWHYFWAAAGMVRVKKEVGGEVLEKHLDLWQPQLVGFQNSDTVPKIDAKAALAVDYNSGQVFYSLNPMRRLPVASLVKMMTALVVLDHVPNPAQQPYLVPQEILTLPLEGSMMGATRGEKYTVVDLLYGLLLTSGNDAALTLAQGVAGTEPDFVYLMNRRARSLGLRGTHFANATGLDDKNAFSTAYDLAVLTRYALEKYPLLKKIVGTKYYKIPYSENHKYLRLRNFNDLLFVDERVSGVKPGNTGEAGSCLIATAQDKNTGRKVLVVVLGTKSRNQPTLNLIDYVINYVAK